MTTDGAGARRARASRALLLSTAAVITAMVSATFAVSPMNGEDYALGRIFGPVGIAARLTSVLERSQFQIETWNARLGEQLAILWLSMPAGVFQLVAVVTFIAFAFLVGTFLSRRATPLVATALAAVSVLALWPLMELFFWRTVNAGYLQPLALTLGCMYFYRDQVTVRALAASRWHVLPVSLLALLSGLSFENVPIAVIPFLLASIVLARPMPGMWRTLVPVAAMTLGWVALLAAPSTRFRNSFFRTAFGVADLDVPLLLSNIVPAAGAFVRTSLPLLLASAVAFALLSWWGYDRRRLVLIAATVAVVVLSIAPAPYIEERAFSLAWALLLAVCVSALHEVWIRYAARRPIVVAAACVLALYFPVRAFSVYTSFAAQINARDAAIKAAVGTTDCTSGLPVPLVTTDYQRRYLNNREPWVENSLAQVERYYGCRLTLR